jgi:thioredoxin 1
MERVNAVAEAVTGATFEEKVLKNTKPVIVDFWAEWCGPCHAVSPVLDKIAEKYSAEVELVKVNVDEESELAQRFGIASIPTMMVFRNGQPSETAIGAYPQGTLERQLGLNAE